jgi:hypothetical protein
MANPDSLWSISTGQKITTLIERSVVNLLLPLNPSYTGTTVTLISGSLPRGLRISEDARFIEGTVYEVAYNTTNTFVLRAEYQDKFEDRTVIIDVAGPDDPVWQTNEGLLPVGSNQSLFILDNEIIDYQLQATDPDLSAGDVLEYYIEEGDGQLPPGVTLTIDGRLQGIVEPLLSLDKRYQAGGYDGAPYGTLPSDYGLISSNGFSSFFYDTVDYDYNEPVVNPRKLNRYYPFRVTVTDGENFVKREFKIYLVGDDYLKADNTIMQASTGVFTADNTNVRTPVWLTPRNLGFKRANNYVTINLDIIDNSNLEGVVVYTLESTNDDGTKSMLPPGTTLDSQSGEIVGNIPYQPAITKDYKFTVRATRITTDLDTVAINANYYEDTLLGKDNFKIFKIDLTGDIDGVNDLLELIGRNILLENRTYRVTNVDARNAEYDIIFLDSTLSPSISLITTRTALTGQNAVFVNRLSESEREKYKGRTIRLSDSEAYVISEIVPYIEWKIEQLNPGNDSIYPSGSPRRIAAGENYFIGDYIIYGSETGGNDRIYRATVSHSVQAQTDGEGNPVKVDDITQVVFTGANWTEVAETLSDLSLDVRKEALQQTLEAAYGHTAYVEVDNQTTWRIRIPSTSLSRIANNIKDFFLLGDDSTELRVSVVRDNEHRLLLDTNLSTQFNKGRNIGIALFAKDGFVENLIVAANDEVDIPSTPKTFELKVIGEIDSEIKWITDSNLGTINANFPSYLKVQAETTVPDSPMIYTIKSGKLPFGLSLSHTGEIIGSPRQFETSEGPGLTLFDNKTTKWDGYQPGDTTFDRDYTFVVEARDRFGFTAIEREFTLSIADLDNTVYTDIYARPMLPESQRTEFRNFTSNVEVFPPSKIYRPNDSAFGIKSTMEMLVYAGIEARKIENFVAAAAKNHKRKSYVLGEVKKAKALEVGTKDNVIYEVVYVEVIDLSNPTSGKTRNQYSIFNNKKITVDSIQYAVKDDETRTGIGYELLPVYGREQVRFVYAEDGKIIIETRDSDIVFDVNNADFEVDIRVGEDVTVRLELSDSEPYRLRPDTNTIKTDSDAIKVGASSDNVRYISNIDNMRSNIDKIGKRERNYLPLWMRSPQEGFQELDYVSAIPICFVKPGEADSILDNIRNSGFDFKQFHIDIDRYIVRRTEEYEDEKYILFANYAYNVG